MLLAVSLMNSVKIQGNIVEIRRLLALSLKDAGISFGHLQTVIGNQPPQSQYL